MGIIGFIAILVVAALLYTMMEPAAEIFSMSLSQTSNQQATDAINLREQIFTNMLFYVLFLAGVFIIARAVFESRRPG